MAALLAALDSTESSWSSSPSASTYPEAMSHLGAFTEYKKTSKRAWVKERQELGALYSNIQTKLKTYALRAWQPRDGLKLEVRPRVVLLQPLTPLGSREALGCVPEG